jgi:RNA polymerase sigma-70 factor (ECF subfamily)
MSSDTGFNNRKKEHSERSNILTLDKYSFERLFQEEYASLCRYSMQFVRRHEIAEEIVQDQYIYIWKNKELIEIRKSYRAYLYKAVRNKSIDYLRTRFAGIEFECEQEISDNSRWENPTDKLETDELRELIGKAIRELPEKCHTIFSMSRYGEMKNQDIADSLNVSVKTVENQITIAIRKIRAFLEKHWMLLIVFFSVLIEAN